MIKILRPWPVYGLLVGFGIGWIISISQSPPVTTSPPATTKPAATKLAPPVSDRLSPGKEAIFVKTLRDAGYVCNSVRNSRYLLSEPGASLYCESWVYDLHQRNGRWTVTPRKGWGQ